MSKTVIITILFLEDGLGTSDFTYIAPNAVTVQDSYPSSPFTEEERAAQRGHVSDPGFHSY